MAWPEHSRRHLTAMWAGLLSLAALGATFSASVVDAQSNARKPKPPVGRDPGGVAVAIIGAGIDYRRPGLAKRLARDGEGEIIAWDFRDNDPRPFEPATATGARAGEGAGTGMAELLLGEAPLSRLVPVRIGDASISTLGNAVAFVSRTPARIAIVPAGVREAPWGLFGEAGQRAKQLLIIMPWGGALDRAGWHGTRETDAALLVTAVTEDGRALGEPTGSPGSPGAADIAIPVADARAGAPAQSVDLGAAEAIAALRLAALAARILAQTPELDGAALKARLLSLAKPHSANTERHGPVPWIADISEVAK